MPSDSEDVSMRVSVRKGHQSSGLFSFKRLHFLNEAKSPPNIPYFGRNLQKQGLQLENAMPGCSTEIAVLDVFVDHYYYYCFKRKREALVRRLICTNSNQSGVEDGVTSEDAGFPIPISDSTWLFCMRKIFIWEMKPNGHLHLPLHLYC